MKKIALKGLFLIYSLILITKPSAGQGIPGIKSGKYLQEIKTEIQLPKQVQAPVVKLFGNQNQIIAVTYNGVFRNLNKQWTGNSLSSCE